MRHLRIFAVIGLLPVAMFPNDATAQGYGYDLGAKLEPTKEIVYRRIAGRGLKLAVFEPRTSQPAEARGALVLFHGGGWGAGSPRMMYSLTAWAAELGLIGISVEYRLFDRKRSVSVFDCVDDARAAVRYVIDHAHEIGINPKRVVVGGASAGGHLAVQTAMMDVAPQALILFSPVIDTSPEGYGQAKIGQRWKELSPVHQVRAGFPRTILFHGTADKVTPYAGARAFHEAMKTAGNDCRLVGQPEAGHTYMFKDKDLFYQTLGTVRAFIKELGLRESQPPSPGY